MLRQDAIGERCARTITVITWLVILVPQGAFAQASSAAADPASTPTAGAQAPPSPVSRSWFSEPGLIARPVDFLIDKFGGDSRGTKSGFYPEFSNMNTGSGWVSAGPGYRQHLLGERLLLDGSAAVSWHLYKMVQGRIELPALLDDHLKVGTQVMWQDQTQVNYFGPGPDSVEADRSQYQVKTTDVVGYARLRPNDWLAFDGTFGWLYRPNLEPAGGTFVPNLPNTLVLFADQPGADLPFQPNFLHGEVAVSVDTRDHRSHPTSGRLYRAALTRYWDQSTGTFTFNEYQAEAMQLVPLFEKRWVLAFRAWAVFSDVPPGHELPFYLEPSIGGQNTLRGYRNYRFHDRDTLVVNGESRWALFDHVDLAAFFDAGNVASRARDLDLGKTSYGAGVRLHTTKATFARLDVAHSPEGWRVLFRTSDPLRLGRVSRRIADIPFAP